MNRRKVLTSLRRTIILLAVVGIVICAILLLNFTASNPTGRRHSSERITPDASQPLKGPEGERILAKDLGLPNNNRTGQQQCICDTDRVDVPSGCTTCFLRVDLPGQGGFVRPDFVGKGIIADSKNTRALKWGSRDQSELALYAAAAEAGSTKLWVFVTVETEVDPRFEDLIEDTGGGIVYYFAVPGYVDPTDRAAWIGLAGCATLGGAGTILELRARRRPVRILVRSRLQPQPVTPVDEAAAFRDRVRQRAQRLIDEDEARRET
ncbi:MAG: hypothetical protein GX573_21995 [Chloroflexi bacterium]|nr:hypothetical protein [Chloroflexota bacterium]